jgi:hypothetical protein
VIDRLSPELALVDDALASDARLRLSVPDDILVLAPVVRLVPAPPQTAEDGSASDVDDRHETALEEDVLVQPAETTVASKELPSNEEPVLTPVAYCEEAPGSAHLDGELPDYLVVPEDEATVPSEDTPAYEEQMLTDVEYGDVAETAVLDEDLPDFLVMPEDEEAIASDDQTSQYPLLPAPEPGLDANDETEAALRHIRERFPAESTAKRRRFRKRFLVVSGAGTLVALVVMAIDVQLGVAHLPGLG